MKKTIPMLLIALLLGCSSEDNRSEAQIDMDYMALHKGRITKALKDPSSVQFKNVFVSKTSGHPIVCGQVNAKNSFGGYSDYERFVSFGDMQVLEENTGKDEMDKIFAKLCL